MRSVSSTDADRLIFAFSPVNSFFCGLVLFQDAEELIVSGLLPLLAGTAN
jgi:hypothetical protein